MITAKNHNPNFHSKRVIEETILGVMCLVSFRKDCYIFTGSVKWA